MTKTTNTVEQEPAMSRRQIVIAAAALATAGVVVTWFTSSRYRVTAADGPLTRSKRPKMSPEQFAKELAKPGPLPEIVVGKEDAPVTIIEYADLTCPACAAFHKTVLPQIKEKYIDTGKAKIVFREFPTTGFALLAVMTVRCVGTDKAWPLASALFDRQDDWRSVPNFAQYREKLFSFGQQVGLTRQAFDNCVPVLKDNKLDFSTPTQKKLLEDIVVMRDRAHETFSVSATPTIFINGKRLPHATAEEFEKAIAPLVNP